VPAQRQNRHRRRARRSHGHIYWADLLRKPSRRGVLGSCVLAMRDLGSCCSSRPGSEQVSARRRLLRGPGVRPRRCRHRLLVPAHGLARSMRRHIHMHTPAQQPAGCVAWTYSEPVQQVHPRLAGNGRACAR
jgi:hypothetical protein